MTFTLIVNSDILFMRDILAYIAKKSHFCVCVACSLDLFFFLVRFVLNQFLSLYTYTFLSVGCVCDENRNSMFTAFAVVSIFVLHHITNITNCRIVSSERTFDVTFIILKSTFIPKIYNMRSSQQKQKRNFRNDNIRCMHLLTVYFVCIQERFTFYLFIGVRCVFIWVARVEHLQMINTVQLGQSLMLFLRSMISLDNQRSC